MSHRRVGDRQPLASVSAKDVEPIAKRDFPAHEVDSVMQALAEYGGAAWHREHFRVRLAILRLAGCDRDALRRHLEIAKPDYRDVRAHAEYPNPN